MKAERPFSPALWEHTPAAVQEDIRALETRVMALETAVQRLEATVQQLTEPLRQDSRTSSRPPSSDPPPAIGKRPRREPSGRRPGGQPGHAGRTRALRPVEEVDVIIPVKPTRCWRCQQPLRGDDPQPQRPHVTEIPPAQPVVTASQLHRVVCPACGELSRGERPPGLPSGACGPRVQAIAALCTGAYHLSKRTTQSVLEALFGGSMRLGTLANLAQATGQAVAAPVAAARSAVPQPPVASLEETGWREGPHRAWLWTAVTAWVTVFVVRRSRRGQVAQALLGERFWGWLVTDRWSGSSWYPTWRRQFCWAHLVRDIEAMIERGGRSQAIGEALRDQARKMFHGWHRVCDGTRAHASVARSMRPVRREVERRLEAGQTCGVPKTAGVCREMLQRRQALWTFMRHDGVEPTNNAAERAIRPGVLWRKGSVGTQSPEGSRLVEAMMTVVTTLTQQHRHVLDDLTAAYEATWRGDSAPALLPTSDHLIELLHPAA